MLCLSLLLYSQNKEVTNKTSNSAEQQNESAAVGCCWSWTLLSSELCSQRSAAAQAWVKPDVETDES